jgi:hypothetical protein
VQVGVADAAVGDVDLDVAWARFATLDGHGFERLIAGVCAVGLGDHGQLLQRLVVATRRR